MNRMLLLKKFQDVEGEVDKLKNTLFELQTSGIRKPGPYYSHLSMDAAIRAEKIACMMRNLAFPAETSAVYAEKAAAAQNIKISMEGRTLHIRFPSLLPKRRKHANAAFLHDPLNHALAEYARCRQLMPYRECVVCFIQVYDRQLGLAQVRDYDNLEFKLVLDIIASHVLIDDEGMYCDAYHTARLGDSSYTEAFVMDKAAFPEWLKKHKSCEFTISEKQQIS